MTLAYAAEPTTFWQQAVELYRAEAAHIDDPHEAASLLVEAGEVLAEHLGQVDGAYAAFDAAQARAPDAVAPLLARARLAEGQADWTEATECLRAALGRLTGTRRVPVLSTLAEICARNLGRPDEAVRLLQEAVTLAPDQRDLLIRLETARPGTEIAARREVLERRLAVTTSLAERGERLAELGGLLEANAPAKAARTFADAYAANPNWGPAVHGLIRTYVDLKRWDALGRALRTHAERITDDSVRAEVYAVCGVIADAHGGDPSRAVADLENAQSIPGVAEDLVLARDRAGLATDDWWAESTDPNQVDRRAYHLAAAGRARLGGPLGAVIERRRALATGDDDIIGEAHAALTRQAVTDDDARVFHLAEGDEALWSTAPHEARAGYMGAVARQTDATQFPEGLIGLRAVARTTDDLDAWRRQVNAALLRTADADVSAALRLWQATNDPSVTETEAWLAMAEVEQGHFGAVDATLAGTAAGVELSALVDAAVAASQSPTRRVRLLLIGAERRVARNDLEGACDRWRAVLTIDPLEVTARNALGRTLHHRAHTEGLAKLIATELAALPTTDARHQDAWLRFARLKSQNGESPAALKMLQGQSDPPWSSRLETRRLADALGDELALKSVLDQPAASPVDVRTNTLERAGVLLDLGETQGATEAVDAVLADAPADVLGAWVRAQLALAKDDCAHALRLTQHQLATARTPGLARINAHRLTAQLPLVEGRALMAERAAEDADAAWYMLCDAAAAGDAHGVVQRLEQLAALVGDRTAQAVLLEAGERAEALGLPPEDRHAIWSRVVEESPGRATQMLLGLHAESSDVDEQVAALTHMAHQADRPAQAAVALWRAGLLVEDSFPQEASRLYWQAIEAWPDDPVALLLALRVGDGGAPLDGGDRAQQLEAIAARLVHDGRAARLLASAAALRDTEGETADARRAWLYAAMRYPEQDALATRALGLLADEGEARIALLEARVRRTTTTAAKAQARHQLAREYIDLRGDRAAAAEVFAQIVQATPGDLDARQEYASLLVGLGRHADAVAQYRIAAQTSAEPSARVALYTRIGELLARHLNDLDGAIQALRQAIGLVDPTGRAQEVLAEVYLRAGEGNRALLAYQRLERMVGDSARRAQARAGQVRALLSDGREADARTRLLGFLKADPFDPVLGALARSLNVELPASDDVEEPEMLGTNGIDLAELDRLSAALDRTQSQQAQADDAVAQASAEAAAMLDLQAFDALEAALAQVTAAHAPETPAVPEPRVVETPPETSPPASVAVDALDAPANVGDVLDLDDEATTDSWAVLDEPDDSIGDVEPAAEPIVPLVSEAAAPVSAVVAPVAESAVERASEPPAQVLEAVETAVIEDVSSAASIVVDVDGNEARTVADDAIIAEHTTIDADAIEHALDAEALVIEAVETEAVDLSAAEAFAQLPPPFESVELDAVGPDEVNSASLGSVEPEPVEATHVELEEPTQSADVSAIDLDLEPDAIEIGLKAEPIEPPEAIEADDADDAAAVLLPPEPIVAGSSDDADFDDFDDIEELSSIELEPWEIEEIESPVVLSAATPPPMPPALPPAERTPSVQPPARPVSPPAALQSSDALAALRDARSALGVPKAPHSAPPAPPSPRGTDSLVELMARVDAVVDGDAPQSAISDSLWGSPADTPDTTPKVEASAAPANNTPAAVEVAPEPTAVVAEAAPELGAAEGDDGLPDLTGDAPALSELPDADVDSVSDVTVMSETDSAIDLDAFDNALFDDAADDDDRELADAEASSNKAAIEDPVSGEAEEPAGPETADDAVASQLRSEPPVASIDYDALPDGVFGAALARRSEEAAGVAASMPAESGGAASVADDPVLAAEPPAPEPDDEPFEAQLSEQVHLAEPVESAVDSLDQAETGEMEALRVVTREPAAAPAWLPMPDSAPPNPFSNLPATVVQPAEMALFEGEPTVVRFDELQDESPELAAPQSEQPSAAPPEQSAATPAPVVSAPGVLEPETGATKADEPTADFEPDDFFGDAPDLLDSLIDDPVPAPPVDRPSANITRTRRSRTTTGPSGPSGSLSGYRRSSDTSAPPAAGSVDRVINAAALAASIARTDDDSTRPQTLAAVALRRQSGGTRIDPPAARARIATNPTDIEAWASLRIATSRGGAARWIADMRAWLDGRMHTGSVVGVPSRLPDGLREALRPASAPLALVRMLRALRTRVPLGLAQAHRPDSLYSLNPHEPLTEVADRVAVALGCPMHDLMLDRSQPYAQRVLADAVPVVCIGDALLSRVPEPGRSFLVGQGLAVLAEGTLPAEVLSEAAFLGFLAAVFDLLGLGGGIEADPAMTAEAAAWVQPVIDPHDETLKALALQVLASFQDVPANTARLGLQTYTRRLALAVTDGLGGALEVMRLLDLDERPLTGLSAEDQQRFFAGNAAARDLVICAASAPCLAVRDWLLKNR